MFTEKLMEKQYFTPSLEIDEVFQEPDAILQWRESEFVYHPKSPIWFAAVIGFSLVLGFGLFFALGQDLFVLIVIAIIAASLVVVGNRKPHEAQYKLHEDSVEVSGKSYFFDEYVGFSVLDEPGHYGVELIPSGRMQLPKTILFIEKDVREIMDIISRHLPYVDNSNRASDWLSRLIRL